MDAHQSAIWYLYCDTIFNRLECRQLTNFKEQVQLNLPRQGAINKTIVED